MTLIAIIVLTVAGFSIAFLSSILGIGGGVFTVPLLYFTGIEIIPESQLGLLSISGSLLFAFIFSTSASWKNWSQKQISITHGMPLIFGSALGAFIASSWAIQIETTQLLKVFAIFLFCNGVYGISRLALSKMKNKDDTPALPSVPNTEDTKPDNRAIFAQKAGLFIAGIFVGILSSFTGVGGGVVIVPLLLYFFKLPARMAISTSTFCIVFTTLSGLISYLVQSTQILVVIPQPRLGFIYIPFIIPLICGGIIGGLTGPHFTRRIPAFYLILLLALTQLIIAAKLLIW